MRASTGFLLVLSMLLPARTNASPLVIPGLAGAEGNTENCAPFICNGWESYQQIYASSYFAGDTLLTSISFRPDGILGGVFSETFTNALVRFGVTGAPANPAGSGISFPLLPTTGMTTVYSGALTIGTAFSGPAGGPKDFDITITFTTPFLYHPSDGNLVFDFRNLGTANFPGGVAKFFDAVDSTSDGVARRYNCLAPAGCGDTIGLVTQFNAGAGTAAPIPEPVSLLLVASGLLAKRTRIRRAPKAGG